MRVSSVLFYFYTLAMLGSSVYAYTLREDRTDHVLLNDQVLGWNAQTCGGRTLWLGERSLILSAAHEQAIPYRTYNVAVPAGTVSPIVDITDLDLTPLQGELASQANCNVIPDPAVPKQVSSSVQFFPIVERDGLSHIQIAIPLLVPRGSGYVRRNSFQVRISWTPPSAVGSGVVGKRALAQVINPNGAHSFARRTNAKVLRKTVSQSVDAGIEWLLSIPVGDNQLATTLEDGMVAITYAQMDSAMRSTGLESRMSGIPVSRLAIAAGTGDTLREVPATVLPTPGPLHEIPILVLDHGSQSNNGPDGIWDSGDTLLFYGTGTSLWKRADYVNQALATEGMEYYFSSNYYSFTRDFFFGVLPTGTQGKRLETSAPVSASATPSALFRYVRAEKDQLLRDMYYGRLASGYEENSGREWFWIWGNTMLKSQAVSAQELAMPQTTSLPGILSGQSAKIAVAFFPYRSVSYSDGISQRSNETLSLQSETARFQGLSFEFLVNGVKADSVGIRQPGGQFVLTSSVLQEAGNRYQLTILPNGVQYDRFDGYSVAYPSQWKWLGTSETWLPGTLSGLRHFPVDGAPGDLRILKISGESPLGFLPLQNGAFNDSLDPNLDVRYHLFQWGKWLTIPAAKLKAWLPISSGVISDLVNLSGNYDYVLISPRQWLPQALQLKDFRSNGEAADRWRTAVVDLESIYQQYGGGVASPVAIRDFLRMARAQWSDLRFALLIGDGHADFRQLRPSSPVEVFPPFEKEEVSSDDYFGVLDSGETLFTGSYDLDLSVGRLPFSSADELSQYLKKLSDYEGISNSGQDNGNWRNTILLAADDAMQGTTPDPIPQHTEQAEDIANFLDSLSLLRGYQLDIQRLYLLAYESDLSYKKPEAARDLITRMNQGALFSFYFGHGAPDAWADEGLLRAESLNDISNRFRYTILGSFACTVGRFDQASSPSLSELFLQANHNGAIASIGAMRESYPGPNKTLAKGILEASTITGVGTLGEAIAQSKGKGYTSYSPYRYNSEKYVLLGEPVLALPRPVASLTLDQKLDTLQALQKVHFSGRVNNGPSSGNVFLEVIEGPETRTLSQERGADSPFVETVQYQGRLIHSEVVPYTDGHFETTFITPRKIKFGDTAAQVRFWSWTPGDFRVGRGLLSGISVFGTSSYADSIHDVDPPEIQFRPCGLPDSLARPYNLGTVAQLETPACIEIVITDSTGVDIREQADEGVSFEVVGNKDPWHPWPFIEQTGTRIVARMDFNERWKPGLYRFRVRAQDILGNDRTEELQVELVSSLQQALRSVFNAPNPMGNSGTTFYFRNLAENHRSQVSIELFNASGRLVQVLRNVRSGITRWDGRDQWGRPLANGLYHYVVTCTVYSSQDGDKPRRFQAKQKLVISR